MPLVDMTQEPLLCETLLLAWASFAEEQPTLPPRRTAAPDGSLTLELEVWPCKEFGSYRSCYLHNDFPFVLSLGKTFKPTLNSALTIMTPALQQLHLLGGTCVIPAGTDGVKEQRLWWHLWTFTEGV